MPPDLHPLVPQQDGQRFILLPAPPQDRFSKATTLHVQVRRYATALRKRSWVLLLSLVAIGGPAVFLAVTKPPTFQSQALMWLAARLNLPNAGSYAEDLASYIATQAQLIKSPVIQSRALEKVRARFPALAAAKRNAASAGLHFDLTVRSSLKGSVVELRAVGPAAQATQAFLDALMDEYRAFKNDSRKRTSSGALSSITGQVNEVQKQIQQQQDELTLFQVSNNISYLTEHGLSAGSHLAKLVEILSDQQTEYRLLELLTPEQFKDLAKGSQYSFSDSPVPGERASRALAVNANWAADTAYYQALQQIEVLKAKRDEFSQVLRPTHSKMVKLNQEIAGLDQLLKTLKDEGWQQALAQMANRRKSSNSRSKISRVNIAPGRPTRPRPARNSPNTTG